MFKFFQRKTKDVAFIGVGKLGKPVAEVMATKYNVVGYDVNPQPTSIPMLPSIKSAISGAHFVFVAVPTPHDPQYGGDTPTAHLPPKDFDYSTVVGVLQEINKTVKPDQIVVLISTVLPGTIRKILQPAIPNTTLVYNPYLIAMGTVANDFVNPEMIIIGSANQKLISSLKSFYRPLMKNNSRYEVGSWEDAEAIKIFYNTFISMKLSFVNMIQDVSNKNGYMDVDNITTALAASDYRITGPAYMVAGMGDAGACHPRDNIALRHLSKELDLGYDLFGAIMDSREAQAKNMAIEILKMGRRVLILGKAYKPRVPYTDGSYSLLVGHYITELGGEVFYYDYNTGDTTHPTVDVYVIGYWDDWVKQFKFAHDMIFDPWRKFTPKTKNVKYFGSMD